MAKGKPTIRRSIRCYLCGHRFEVSAKTLSVPCPSCHKALKVEDISIKSYLPVNDVQTCGKIIVAKNGRVVARVIRSGHNIECEGVLEGAVEADGVIQLGPKSTWKGKSLMSRAMTVQDGAVLVGQVKVPWDGPTPPPSVKPMSNGVQHVEEVDV